METRVLLREGSSIRENKFSYDKSLWKKNFFMKQTSLYERKSATMRRKFYFLRHPKFQDLEKTKKTKRTQKNIISELFLETPQIPRPRKNQKKKKNIISELFLETPQIPRPLENCFFLFFLVFCKTSGFFLFFLVFCKTSGKLFLLVFEESIADVHPHAFAEIISFENFIEK